MTGAAIANTPSGRGPRERAATRHLATAPVRPGTPRSRRAPAPRERASPSRCSQGRPTPLCRTTRRWRAAHGPRRGCFSPTRVGPSPGDASQFDGSAERRRPTWIDGVATDEVTRFDILQLADLSPRWLPRTLDLGRSTTLSRELALIVSSQDLVRTVRGEGAPSHRSRNEKHLNRKPAFDQVFIAGVPGLEPRTTEPESAVLPITPHPIGGAEGPS